MGRLGITYSDVENAANALKSKGLNPTVDAVRAILGTGSKSTIVPYLKRWRSVQVVAAEKQGTIISLIDEDKALGNSSGSLPKLLNLIKEVYKDIKLESEVEITRLKSKLHELEESLRITEKEKSRLLAEKKTIKVALQSVISKLAQN